MHPAPTEIYTLSLHDALPILVAQHVTRDGDGVLAPADALERVPRRLGRRHDLDGEAAGVDRKSTRLNSSHVKISYAVFCLKKKKRNEHARRTWRMSRADTRRT